MVLEILFSYTTVAVIAFLLAVAVAAYVGTTVALRRHLEREKRRDFGRASE